MITVTTAQATTQIVSRAEFNPIFRPVNEFRGRYRVLKGSAGSGKSVNIAQDYIIKLSDMRYQGANLLAVRKVEESNRNSTFAELQAAVGRIFGSQAARYWKINENPMSMESRVTGNRIIFCGMNDWRQRDKVRSINFKRGKLVWIWCEEATDLLVEDVDILDDRLRGTLHDVNPFLYYQITFTFNPVSATHWLKGRYFDVSGDRDILAHHSTYRDNRFIDAAYYRRMERRRVQDPDGYRVYGLGEWGELGGLILTNFEIHDFGQGRERFDAFYYGQDFGFNHANAILGVGWKDGELYVTNEIYVYEMDTTEIIAEAGKPLWPDKKDSPPRVDKRVEMFSDPAEPDRIKMWSKAGYRQGRVNKYNNVRAQIDFLKGRKIHIHPSCAWTQKEIGQWKWKKDKTTGLYIDEPVEFFDDAMAALRYSVERLRKGPSLEVLK